MSRFCLLSGTTMDSKWVAWRTAFLAAFILSMMVNMNYGASLVSSLLSTPVKTIRTTRDLIDSSLQFAAEDISYSFPYFAVSNNDVLFAHFNQLISCHQIRSEMRSMNLFPTSDPSYFRPRNISSTWDLSSKKVSLQSSAMISSGSKLLFLLTTHTGRFIVFSVITNIYNKKTKGPTLMELFKSTGKQKSFFLTTRDVRCVHHWWHGTHRYDIQVLATHASTWVFSACTDTQFQQIVYTTHKWSCLRRVLRVLCTKCTLHSNHRLTRVIFQHTKRLLPRSGHFPTTYTRIA